MSSSAHVEAERRLRVSVTSTIQRIWRGLPSYNEADLEQWLRQALPIIEVGQRTSAQITRAYLSKQLKMAPPPSDLSAYVGAELRAGTPPTEVYRRPFVTTWTALKSGAAYQDAVDAGLARAAGTAAMDVQLAMRAAARDSFQAAGVETYHRIPDGNACELCLIASANVYRTADLMPIHNGCGCSVGPGEEGKQSIFDVEKMINQRLEAAGDSRRWDANTFSMTQAVTRAEQRAQSSAQRAADVARELAAEQDPKRRARLRSRQAQWERRAEQQRAQAAKDRAQLGDRANPDLLNIAVHEHGELGPVLTNASHGFTEL